MKNKALHILYFPCMTVLLLCTVLCRMTATLTEDASVLTKTAAAPTYETEATTYASLCEKKANIPHSMHEMQLCGMPATSASLQGTTGRTSTIGQVLHRVNRTHSSLLASIPTYTYELPRALFHAISAKLFHFGYYIYYRCQMRC